MNDEWKIIEDGNYIHIVPSRDIKPHGKMVDGEYYKPEGVDCLCKPIILSNFNGHYLTYIKVLHRKFTTIEAIDRSMMNPIVKQ